MRKMSRLTGQPNRLTDGGVSFFVDEKKTPRQQQVLDLLQKEFLTQTAIAVRLRISKQAVNKIIKELKKKGLFHWSTVPKEVMVDKVGGGSQPTCGAHGDLGTKNTAHEIRLHGQMFRVGIIKDSSYYMSLLNAANRINLDGNTVALYKDCVVIYSGQSFFGRDANEATANSITHLNRLLVRLENDLRVLLTKPRAQNIKQVKAHYAEVNNELATETEQQGIKIQLYAKEDGRVWFTIDNSLNLHEAETQHTVTAQRDMQDVIAPFFNQLRENPHVLGDVVNSLVVTGELVKQIGQAQLNTSKQLEITAKLLNPGTPEVLSEPGERATYIG